MQRIELLPLVLDHQTFFQNCPDIIPRISPFSPCLDGSEINLICGPLHAGKTSFLKLTAGSMKGLQVYINFEDSRFRDLGPESLQEIKEIAAEYCIKRSEDEEGSVNKEKTDKEGPEGPISYFLDEIQYLPDWEDWLEGLQNPGVRIFITSSSGPVQELSSRFANKIKVLKLLPFSFKEYLTLKGLRVPRPNFLTPSRSDEMLCLFLRYFENGGFPDIIKSGNSRLSRKYFEETLQKGIIDRHNVQDPGGLKRLAVFLISNMASEYSMGTLKRASGIDCEDTVTNYLDYLEEVFLLYRVPMFNNRSEKSEDGKEKSNGEEVPCKVYAGDTGFFKSVFPNYPDSLGLRFENLVFLELLRQGKQVSYFRDRRECDFIICEKDSQAVTAAVQVCLCSGSPAVREREVLGLMEAMEEFGLNEGLILTMDDEEVMEIEGKDGKKKRIIINSVWKWMLG
jgi:predicted AAA+ superfamily ATPase